LAIERTVEVGAFLERLHEGSRVGDHTDVVQHEVATRVDIAGVDQVEGLLQVVLKLRQLRVAGRTERLAGHCGVQVEVPD
jgi:hypothetical protein